MSEPQSSPQQLKNLAQLYGHSGHRDVSDALEWAYQEIDRLKGRIQELEALPKEFAEGSGNEVNASILASEIRRRWAHTDTAFWDVKETGPGKPGERGWVLFSEKADIYGYRRIYNLSFVAWMHNRAPEISGLLVGLLNENARLRQRLESVTSAIERVLQHPNQNQIERLRAIARGTASPFTVPQAPPSSCGNEACKIHGAPGYQQPIKVTFDSTAPYTKWCRLFSAELETIYDLWGELRASNPFDCERWEAALLGILGRDIIKEFRGNTVYLYHIGSQAKQPIPGTGQIVR